MYTRIVAWVLLLMLTVLAPVSAQNRGSRVLWSGDVDGTIELLFRKREVKVHKISGKNLEKAQVFFDSSLPEKRSDIQLIRKEGRGTVTIFQKPAKSNKYTTGVRIADDQNGRSHYQIVLRW